MILGRGLLHKVSSRNKGPLLFLSRMIRWCHYKKDSPYFNVQPRGTLFLTWSLNHSISYVPMLESLTLYFNQVPSPPLLCKQTSFPLLHFKHSASPPLMCNQVESPLLCAPLPSSASPYRNKHFRHRFCKNCLIYLS